MKRKLCFVVLLVTGLLSCGPAGMPTAEETIPDATAVLRAPEFPGPFWDYWSDGQAELAGYDLTIPRYRELRRGTAVAIFVTETFSDTVRVKADQGKHAAADEFPVMKLNLVEDFPAGIYDYNVMLSSFVALEAVNARSAGLLTKASFSSQEWCGHVYSQLLFDPRRIRHTLHSYFDGEQDQHNALPYPENGISEDALWFWARGFAAPKLEPGESARVPLLMSLQESRFTHRPVAWRAGTLSRSSATEEVSVPAGDFTVEKWVAALDPASGGVQRSRTFYVEQAEPHRIVRWESSDGEVAQMIAGERLQYWRMNGNDYAAAVEKLGLSRRPPRTP